MEYQLAKSRYDAGSYEDAAERFEALLDADDAQYLRDPLLRQQARKVYAATLIALDRNDDAKQVIRAVLQNEPRYRPAPGVYPQKVIDLYIAVANDMLGTPPEPGRDEEIAQLKATVDQQARQIAELKAQNEQETVVERRSRLVAMVPFGAGQFQNGDTGLGWFFATSEVLAIAATAVSSSLAQDRASANCPEDKSLDCEAITTEFEVARTTNWVSFGATVTLMVAGIIQAQVALEEEVVTTRPRAKQNAFVLPTLVLGGGDDGGVTLGLGAAGRF